MVNVRKYIIHGWYGYDNKLGIFGAISGGKMIGGCHRTLDMIEKARHPPQANINIK